MGKEMMILCDTNIIIEFYKQRADIVKNLQIIGQENIAISSVTVGELLFGALNKRELQEISNAAYNLRTITLTPLISECFVELMQKYSLSHRLSVPDGLIAATAITEELKFYTLNLKDFKYIEGLQLYQC